MKSIMTAAAIVTALLAVATIRPAAQAPLIQAELLK